MTEDPCVRVRVRYTLHGTRLTRGNELKDPRQKLISSPRRRVAPVATQKASNHKREPPSTMLFLSASRRLAHRASTRRLQHSLALKETYDNILVETNESRTALITLHRPKALNALSDALLEDLLHATQVLDDSNDIRCLVITGSAKAFAAGADISEMKSKSFEQGYSSDMFAEWQNISQLKTPWIAAVSGYCLGGGCELAMMSDILLCSDSAQFGQPEINLGVLAGAGGTQRLTRAIGKAKSMKMNLTGDFMSATEAEQSGLVAQVYDSHESLLEGSLQMATKIASQAPLAVQAVKEAVNAAEELPLQEGLRLERRLFHSMFATEDQKEGMSAFLEKRKPNFG